MRRGFEFDTVLCVRCNACNAACTLENGLQPGTRTIYTWNIGALPVFSVVNISLACNHCEKPACLEGCPAKAYSIDPSGAVIHYKDKCMGCRYCTWRCPYDAPKINESAGYIEKCHFCTEREAEGIEPACVTACPTGALKTVINEDFVTSEVAWFPDTGIIPSVSLKRFDESSGPVIIPDESDDEEPLPPVRENRLKKEWSLIVFSLLIITAAVFLISAALNAKAPSGPLPAIMMAGAIIISFVHLGVPYKAWRSGLNILRSPLSREILLVTTLTGLAFLNWLLPGSINPIISASIAVITLISVDLVYFSADRSPMLKFHTGQAFFCGIFAASWFIVPNTLFIVFSLLAALSSVTRYRSADRGSSISFIYYLRALSLPVVFLLLYPGSQLADIAATIVFATGIAADRVLFYDDFNPVNIRETITEDFYNSYEKERDKQCQDTGLS